MLAGPAREARGARTGVRSPAPLPPAPAAAHRQRPCPDRDSAGPAVAWTSCGPTRPSGRGSQSPRSEGRTTNLTEPPPQEGEVSMSDRQVPVLIVGGSLVGLTDVGAARRAWRAAPAGRAAPRDRRSTRAPPRSTSARWRSSAASACRRRSRPRRRASSSRTAPSSRSTAWPARSLPVLLSAPSTRASKALSPTSRLFITQVGLEPLLRRSARELGAEHALRHRADRLRAGRRRGHRSVSARADGGAERTVRAAT